MATKISNEADKLFDIILHIKSHQLVKSIKNEDAGFDKWCYMLNHKISMDLSEEEREIQIKDKNIAPAQFNGKRTLKTLVIEDNNGEENIIMSLTFQLNQLLMLINNPLYFPHYAYVERFNKIFKENKTDFYK